MFCPGDGGGRGRQPVDVLDYTEMLHMFGEDMIDEDLFDGDMLTRTYWTRTCLTRTCSFKFGNFSKTFRQLI